MFHYCCVMGFGGGGDGGVFSTLCKENVLSLLDVLAGQYSLLGRHSTQITRPTRM